MDTPKQIFRAGKLIAANTPHSGYVSESEPRGSKSFTVSRSALMEFHRCPARWVNGYKGEETPEQSWGSLVDCLALAPKEFESRYAITPATYPAKGKKKGEADVMKPWNRNATYCKEWEEDVGPDKELVIYPQYLKAKEAAAVLLADKAIASLLHTSDKQVMLTADYHDPATKLRIPVKILVDLAPAKDSPFADGLADLKTCDFAGPATWTKHVFNWQYHVQAALYLDVWNCATGESRTGFYHVLQESYAPFQTAKRILTADFIDLGRVIYRRALARYAQCLKTGLWPDYDDPTSYQHWHGWSFTAPEGWMLQTV